MPIITRGQPWQGQEYNEQLSPRYTHALARAVRVANIEAVSHPGITPPAYYADANSPWRFARPAPILPQGNRQAWLDFINGGSSAPISSTGATSG